MLEKVIEVQPTARVGRRSLIARGGPSSRSRLTVTGAGASHRCASLLNSPFPPGGLGMSTRIGCIGLK